jgi:hypothetical protein
MFATLTGRGVTPEELTRLAQRTRCADRDDLGKNVEAQATARVRFALFVVDLSGFSRNKSLAAMRCSYIITTG